MVYSKEGLYIQNLFWHAEQVYVMIISYEIIQKIYSINFFHLFHKIFQ